MKFDFKPGSLVTVRNRPWVVLPSEDTDIFLIKPLGGSEEEITGIYKPLASKSDIPVSYNFLKPDEKDLGDFPSARLLYNAARISFRSAAGPFRCLGKLSFRPRSYQMLPLIMALRQEKVRLLIADDVGVGKTIEALLIARELYERKEIKSFAIVCLPHLCEQWQEELKNKFGMEAVIIRSGTASTLERQIRADENLFQAFPFQIISIDYIKMGNKRQIFIDFCPDLLIVDEAHTCAKPEGASNSQQLRYHLLRELSLKKKQHLLLLTATPHSGKQAEFQSLLGLLEASFEAIDISKANENERKTIAKHFIQRRRADVLKWLDEETKFPSRNAIDKPFEVGKEYAEIFNEILSYARENVASFAEDKRKQRFNYWDALALLRGVMSSPAAGVSMLKKKMLKKQILTETEEDTSEYDFQLESQSVMDMDFSVDDNLPLSVLTEISAKDAEVTQLLQYAERLELLCNPLKDTKAKEAINYVREMLTRGYNPIIFCRYIQTANYLGKLFSEIKDKTFKNVQVEVITSELNDELRREKINSLKEKSQRLLIATDCLSEGINLQDGFNALLHYDLPWNPNRLEQREGRIDRFGQTSPFVEVALLYGSNNPIDGVVLEVLLRKAREIRKSTGISVPFPENSASVMEAVTNAILLKPKVSIKQTDTQLAIFDAEEIELQKNKVARAFEEAEKREKASRSIFAQNTIKASEIEADLKEVDEAIGNVKAVSDFVTAALRAIGAQVTDKKEGFSIQTANINNNLLSFLTDKKEIAISFQSPTPKGYQYLGRNHLFVENLAQTVLNDALDATKKFAARAAVVRTKEINIKTVLLLLRVRNVIAALPSNRQIVAEEMWVWGYKGDIDDESFLSKEEAMTLFLQTKASKNIELGEQNYWLKEELEWIKDETVFRKYTDTLALERAKHLVEAHTRFKQLVSGTQYQVVEPVLPMDVLGIYILLPEVSMADE